MALILKSDTAFTDVNIPILYRDMAISAGTLFCYDALDTFSWPSQAAPSGAAALIDLAQIANASIDAAAMGWGASGGFVFTSDDADKITLPVSSKLASNVASYGFTFWFKPTTVADGLAIIGGLGASLTDVQYSFYRDGSILVVHADNTNIGQQNGIVAGQVYQVGITIELSGSTYTRKIFINGAQITSNTSTAPFATPSQAAFTFGAGLPGNFSQNGDAFTLFRCHADALTSRTAAEFIAADYASGVGRFS